MSPRFSAIALSLALAACTDPTDGDDDTDVGTDTADTGEEQVVETGLDTGLDTDVEDTGVAGITFEGGRYLVTELRILGPNKGIDLDGMPGPDNNVASLLQAIGLLPLGIGLQDVNRNIGEALNSGAIIVLFDAVRDGQAITVDVVQGENTDAGIQARADSYEAGVAKEQLKGTFDSPTTFTTGPNDITLPFQFDADEPTLQITGEDALSEMELDGTKLKGNLAGAFTVDTIMDNIIEPLVNDTFGEGTEASNNWIRTAEAAVQLQVDLQVDGEDAISGAFAVEAIENDWLDATP